MPARSLCLALVMACMFLTLGCGDKPKTEVPEEFKTQFYRFLKEAETFDHMALSDVLVERKEQQLLRVKVTFGSLLSVWPVRFSPTAQRDLRAAINAWDLGLSVESTIRMGRKPPPGFGEGASRTATRENLKAAYAEGSEQLAEGKAQILADLHNDAIGR